MTRKRVQTAAIRKNRALGAMDSAISWMKAGQYDLAAGALDRAAAILREPVKDHVICNDPNAGMCAACDCWKQARAYAS
ncbi:MAG: hypothetical protein ABL308_12765 [Oceanicaulis sp.]